MRSYTTPSLHAIWFLVALNILVFIVTMVRPDVVLFLGMTPALFLRQPWTIVTSIFVHGSFYHILFNMISLFFLGSFLIRVVGERSFLWVYFLGGLAGNALFMVLAHPASTGVGASGAIYAVGGTLAMMAPRLPVFVFPFPFPIPLWVAIIGFLVLSFIIPGIAWQAHVGGLLLGLIAGYLFKRKRGAYRRF